MVSPPCLIYFEDSHLLVVSKPGGWLTQPNGSAEESLEDRLKAWLQVRDQKAGRVFLHALHRLDRPASGLVLFAKSAKALRRLNAHERLLIRTKIYHVCVEGNWQESEGRLMHWLVHGEHRAHVVSPDTVGAKQAVLDYRVLGKTEKDTRLEVTLRTGRYHQIRCQFAHEGYPILGDRKYGSRYLFLPVGTIALHHAFLEIEHPVTRVRLQWSEEQIAKKSTMDVHSAPSFIRDISSVG